MNSKTRADVKARRDAAHKIERARRKDGLAQHRRETALYQRVEELRAMEQRVRESAEEYRRRDEEQRKARTFWGRAKSALKFVLRRG